MPALSAVALGALLAAPPDAPFQAPAPAPSPATLIDRIAAVVGDEVVLESEVEKFVALRYLASRPGETPAAYRDRVLDELVTDVLRERELRKAGGLEPEAVEVDSRLRALAARVEAERGVPFEESLKAAGITAGEARAYVRRGLMLETYTRERLFPTIRMTDAEIRAFYEGPFRDEARAKGVETLPPLPDVLEDVRNLLRERKLNEAIARWTEELRQSTRILIYRR